MGKKHVIVLFIAISVLAISAISCQLFSGSNQQDGDAITSPKAVKGKPDDVEIVGTNVYRDFFSNWRVYGLLTNIADYPVDDIEIEIEIMDTSGSSVHKESFVVSMGGLAPGDTTPFSLIVREELTSVDQVTANVESLYKAEFEPAEVEIIGTYKNISEDGIVQVTGEINNPSDNAVILKQIATAIFSPEGDILFARGCDICVRYLAPGEKGPFKVLMFGYPNQIDTSGDFQIYVSAETMTPLETIEVSFSDYEHTFTDNYKLFHAIGEIQNNSEYIFDIHLLNTLYDANGNVIDVSSYNVLPASLSPGESAPYDIIFGGPQMEAVNKGSVTWKSQLDYFSSRPVDDASFELGTSGDSHEFSGARGTFTGMVLNNTGEELQVVLVVVGLRDKSGNLVGLGRELLWDGVPDGESIEYSVPIELDPSLNTSALEHFLIARGR